jgi:hypothetical protein
MLIINLRENFPKTKEMVMDKLLVKRVNNIE